MGAMLQSGAHDLPQHSCAPGDRAFREFAREAIEQSIGARFEAQVRKHEGCLAVRTGRHCWTYGELNHEANRIAAAILAARGEGPEPVALLLAHGAPQIAAILAVLKAGKAYLALDPSYPLGRLDSLLEEAATEIVLCDSENLATGIRIAGAERTLLPIDGAGTARGTTSGRPSIDVPARATAYIFQTSGSTGNPKGVFDEHRNVLHNVLRYTNALRIRPCDRLTLLQSCSYSGSVSSLFTALLNGAAVFPFDLLRAGPTALGEWVREQRITVYHSVPTIFRSFLSGDSRFPDVRIIRLEGDRSTRADVDLFRQHFDRGCVLVNGLGTTETGIVRQYFVNHDTRVADGILPVGYAVCDMDVLVVRENGSPQEPGRAGEVAVRSEYLASGYWRRPDLTAAAFRPDPGGGAARTYLTGDRGRLRADGCLEYLGRMRSAPKVRGNHIEPAEIEDALLRLPEIAEVVAGTVERESGETDVVAYIVWVPGSNVPQVELRRAISGTLPSFMIPSYFITCDVLPVDPNGKHDRRALLESLRPIRTASDHRSPAGPVEAEIARVFESVLGIDGVGTNESFFDLGGDSLAAAEVCAQIGVTHGLNLPPATLLRAPTVTELAELLRHPVIGGGADLVPLQANGTRRPLFLVSGQSPAQLIALAALARLLGSDQPVWGLCPLGTDPIPALSTRCLEEIREAQPIGPYRLGGWCFGAVVAFEMAHQLLERGEEVEFLGLLGISPYDFSRLVHPRAWRRYRHYHGLDGVVPSLRYHLACTRALPASQRLGYLWRIGSRVVPYARNRIGCIVGRGLEGRESAESRAAVEAFEHYVPSKFRGHATLFFSDVESARYSRDPVADWGSLADTVDVRLVRASHAEMLDASGLNELALLVGYALERCRHPFP